MGGARREWCCCTWGGAYSCVLIGTPWYSNDGRHGCQIGGCCYTHSRNVHEVVLSSLFGPRHYEVAASAGVYSFFLLRSS